MNQPIQLLSFILLLFISIEGHSQVNGPPDPCTDGSQNTCQCDQSPILCSINELDGFTYEMTTYLHPADGPTPMCDGPDGFGTASHNPTWFAFLAWCTDLTIEVAYDNCIMNPGSCTSLGIQAAVYEDCSLASNSAIACDTDIIGCVDDGVRTLDITGMTVGDIYYFLVDGCCGSACDIEITVVQDCGVPDIPDWDQDIQGPESVCVSGNDYTYSVDEHLGADIYYWYLDGIQVDSGTDLLSVDLNFSSAGTYQICVDVDNMPCIDVNDNPEQLCLTVTVGGAINDECSDAIIISQNGTLAGETNDCATYDIDAGSCGGFPGVAESSVWYEYTLSNDVSDITISLISISIVSPSIVIYEDCTGTLYDENDPSEDCNGSEVIIDCPTQGTLLIQVSSESINTGTFDITITEGTPVVTHDVCTDPMSVSLVACETTTVMIDNTDACPEESNLGAGLSCSYDVNPTVWVEVVVPSGGTGFEIQNISSGAMLSVFDNNCPPTTIFDNICISSDEEVIVATGTYLIAVSSNQGDEGVQSFDITTIVPPTNDQCADAEVLTLGTTSSGTTVCATIDVGGYCSSVDEENTVFYEWIAVMDYSRVAIDVTNFTPQDGGGTDEIGLAVFEDCGFTTLLDIDLLSATYCGASGTELITFDCVEAGDAFTIVVSSSTANEGDFDITINEITPDAGCDDNNSCSNLTADPFGEVETDNGPECYSLCNTYACAESDVDALCGGPVYNLVYYEFTTDANFSLGDEIYFDVEVMSGLNNPILLILEGNCGAYTLLPGTGCSAGASGQVDGGSLGYIQPNTTYTIAVGTTDNVGGDDFELCIEVIAGAISYDCPSLSLDIGDDCDDGNPDTSDDIVLSDCTCVGEYDCPSLSLNIGDSCDDGNPATSDDVILSDCTCAGEYDCPSLLLNIGDFCNDGNPETENDVVQPDCTCAGEYDCPSLSLNIGDFCNDGNPNTDDDVVLSNCTCLGEYDCPALQLNIGDPCDDGNPITENDAIQANCVCIGEGEFDCLILSLDIGDPCDDNNPNTVNDTVLADCTCQGQKYYNYQCLDQDDASIGLDRKDWNNGDVMLHSEGYALDFDTPAVTSPYFSQVEYEVELTVTSVDISNVPSDCILSQDYFVNIYLGCDQYSGGASCDPANLLVETQLDLTQTNTIIFDLDYAILSDFDSNINAAFLSFDIVPTVIANSCDEWQTLISQGLLSIDYEVCVESFVEIPLGDEITNPFDLSTGEYIGNTCCANGGNFGPFLNPNGEPTNLACNTSFDDHTVWMAYHPPANFDAVEFIYAGVNASVEIYSGSPGGPYTHINGAELCLISDGSLVLPHCDITQEFLVKVSTHDEDCGIVTVLAQEYLPCEFADVCTETEGEFTPITDPSGFNASNYECLTGCLEVACPDGVGTCGYESMPTVWFQVDIDDLASQLYVAVISTDGSWDPVFSIFGGTCPDALMELGTPATPPCNNGWVDPVQINQPPYPNGQTTYWIAVGGDGFEIGDDPTFEICVLTTDEKISCLGDGSCTPAANFEVVERDSDPGGTQGLSLDGPFCEEEIVTICSDFDYDSSKAGYSWLQGIVPIYGSGWDLSAFDPHDATVTGNGMEATWYDAGVPIIQESMPHLCTYVDDFGFLQLCNNLCTACSDCNGGMAVGDELPGGWFWVTNGNNLGCENDGTPGEGWGIGSHFVTIELCIELQVKEFVDINECQLYNDLSFGFQTFSDGVTGCKQDPVAECLLDEAQIFVLSAGCSMQASTVGGPVEICNGDIANMEIISSDGLTGDIVVNAIPNASVSGATDHSFVNGQGIITDILINETSSPQIQVYEAYTLVSGTDCSSEVTQHEVVIYPDLEVSFVLPDPVVVCYDDEITFEPIIVGGTSNTFTYEWTDESDDESIVINNPSQYPLGIHEMCVTVTDDLGCTGEDCFTFEIRPEIIVQIVGPSSGCLDCDDGNNVIDATLTILDQSAVPIIPTSLVWEIEALNGGQLATITPPGGTELYLFDCLSAPLTPVPGGIMSTPGEFSITVSGSDEFGCQFISEPFIYETFSGPEITVSQLSVSPMSSQYFISALPVSNSIIEICEASDPSNILTSLFGQGEVTLSPGMYLIKARYTDIECPTVQSLEVTLSPMADLDIQSGCSDEDGIVTLNNCNDYSSIQWSADPQDVGCTYTIPASELTSDSTFVITLTDNNGLESNVAVTLPAISIVQPTISGFLHYCLGGSTTLSVNEQFASYFWSTGEATQSIVVLSEGTYSITVTDLDGCTGQTSVDVSQGEMEIDQCNTDCALGDLEVWNAATCSCEIMTVTVSGCTNVDACNYDPLANCDDGSCLNFDCCGTESNIGDPCDDGDATTQNDSITNDCNCAGDPIDECDVAVGSIADLCNSEASVIDLDEIEFPVDEGLWTFVGPSSDLMLINGAGAGSVLDIPTTTDAGTYSLRYTVPGFTPECSDSLSFNVFAQPFALLSDDQEVCNNDTLVGVTCLDFTTLIIDGDLTGVWTADPTYEIDYGPVIDWSSVCFDGLEIGNIYEFVYTVLSTFDACDDSSDTLSVNVIQCDEISSTNNFISNAINVFPNPVYDILNMKNEGQPLNYQVVSSQGIVILNGQLGSSLSLDLSRMASGVYFLRLKNVDAMETYKFVKVE